MKETIYFPEAVDITAYGYGNIPPGAFDDNGDWPDGNVNFPHQPISPTDVTGDKLIANAMWMTDEGVADYFNIHRALELAVECDDWEAFINAVQDKLFPSGLWSHYGAYGAMDSTWIIAPAAHSSRREYTMSIINRLYNSRRFHPKTLTYYYESELVDLVKHIEYQCQIRGLRLYRWETGNKRSAWIRHITYAITPENRPARSNMLASGWTTSIRGIEGTTRECRAYKALVELAHDAGIDSN